MSQDESLFKATFTMDYKTARERSVHREVMIEASDMLDARQQVKARLHSGGRNEPFFGVLDAETGEMNLFHSMKVGDVIIEEAE